jgi:hypothetical protein
MVYGHGVINLALSGLKQQLTVLKILAKVPIIGTYVKLVLDDRNIRGIKFLFGWYKNLDYGYLVLKRPQTN